MQGERSRAAVGFGSDLVGVVLHGSWVRAEATASSDIDALVVLEPSLPITRDLYRTWDRTPMEHDGHTVEVHFVGLPHIYTRYADGHLGWPSQAPFDGIVVADREGRIARYLAQVRHAIATGTKVRRSAHGQPYWTVAS